MSPREQEDSLGSLEDRIQKAVQLVARLRQEREAAAQKASEAQAEAGRLAEEIKVLQAERKKVRDRIEKLLATIDQLNAV
jgi:chromosome segregation ATPase